ncbi:class I SAM-dependent methyltransferase [Xenophilus azovorans]|uniref:class I SAM-dependent methyltransferase n=1 Tax=Xenophilus TaxID=151754 RepID=UPI0005708BE0|nr:methyltransferase domain-containing protein [Xenophilus azovorans]
MIHLSPTSPTAGVRCSVERFSFFHQTLHLSGHVVPDRGDVVRLALRLGDGRVFEITRRGLASPDLTRRHGARARACRFDELLSVGADTQPLWTAELLVHTDDGRVLNVPVGVGDQEDPSVALMNRFFHLLSERPPGHLLEVGSRARTGAIYTDRLPPGWRYTGLDVMEGPNVDVVGDAHQMSRLLPLQAFDAAMSFVVFEHLLMPWKVALEMNRVLRQGALALVMAPQTWPLHEEPCDYFRFSRHAWKALFNRATGFEILEAVHGCTGYVVAHHATIASHFGEAHTVALMSCVLVRKVAETTLQWPVEMDEIAEDVYPF